MLVFGSKARWSGIGMRYVFPTLDNPPPTPAHPNLSGQSGMLSELLSGWPYSLLAGN